MLISWGLQRANAEGIVTYLDTELDGSVVKMYEKHGFAKVDEVQVPLSTCGLEGNYTHIAMIKEPKSESNGVKKDEVPSIGS